MNSVGERGGDAGPMAIPLARIGFTGTHRGMTYLQKAALRLLLDMLQPNEFHHGDCIGADAEAHHLVKEGVPGCRIVVHPPLRTDSRAACNADIEWPPTTYIKRNRHIVVCTELLIATPFERSEQRRGGTWSTVRFALHNKRPVLLIRPDGNQVCWNVRSVEKKNACCDSIVE